MDPSEAFEALDALRPAYEAYQDLLLVLTPQDPASPEEARLLIRNAFVMRGLPLLENEIDALLEEFDARGAVSPRWAP